MKIYEIVSDILIKLSYAASQGGLTTIELDKMAEQLCKEYGVTPYNKGYKPDWANVPYPATICANVNGIVAHGIPSNYRLKNGDIISIDLGIKKDGVCGDAAIAVGVGEVSKANQKLMDITKQTVYEALKHVKAGAKTFDITAAIEGFVIKNGYVVNRMFAGHTIGKEMHMPPSIYNTLEDVHKYDILKEGQWICIEPMITYRDNEGAKLSDGWTWITRDRLNSCLFEHMVEVTKTGYKVLTTHFSNV